MIPPPVRLKTPQSPRFPYATLFRSRLKAEVSPAMEAIVLKAMSKSPAERYPTARAFADDIGRAMQGVPIAAPAPAARSEEHTSELQSRLHRVCRLSPVRQKPVRLKR